MIGSGHRKESFFSAADTRRAMLQLKLALALLLSAGLSARPSLADDDAPPAKGEESKPPPEESKRERADTTPGRTTTRPHPPKKLELTFLGKTVPINGIITANTSTSVKRAQCTVGNLLVESELRTGVLELRVPEGIDTSSSPAGPSVEVSCTISGATLAPIVASQDYVIQGGLGQLYIESITPSQNVLLGGTVRLQMSRGFSMSRVNVSIGSESVDPTAIDDRVITVLIPEEIEEPQPVVAVQAGNELSKPFLGLTLVLPPPPMLAEPDAPAMVEPTSRPWERLGWFLPILLALLVGLVFALRELRRVKSLVVKPLNQEPPKESTQGDSGPPPVDDPHVPDDLVSASAQRQCVLFAGSAFGELAGHPKVERVLLDFVTRESQSSGDSALRSRIDEAQLKNRDEAIDEAVLDRTLELFPTSQVSKLLQARYSEGRKLRSKMSDALRALRFRSVLTTSWDETAASTLGAVPWKGVASDFDMDRNPPQAGPPVVAALRGGVKDPSSLVLTFADLVALARSDEELRRHVATQFYSCSILFIGASLREIDRVMTAFGISERGSYAHHALVPFQRGNDLISWSLQQRLGIVTLPVNPARWEQVVEAFLDELVTRTRRQGETERAERDYALTGIELRNIGSFRELSLDLRPGWNVLLGNNGCGKSTVLKAIGAALCGESARAKRAAAQLLRVGESDGTIRLFASPSLEYRTTLRRIGSEVEVTARQATPLETGRWLVLGFPAVRGTSLRDPAGPSDRGTQARPVPDDVYPVFALSDDRMGDLKQWIVNLYVRSKDESASDHEMSARLINAVFELMSQLTPGVKIKFGRVDLNTFAITVRTDDGEVPLSTLSQGMTSVLALAGVLLKRLYEAYPRSKEPQTERGLLLIDELDAHMHPAWQSALPGLFKKAFPNMQVVVTTHSPLIAGNMEAGEVTVVSRDSNGSVGARPINMSLKGHRADQILTGAAFGLASSRDPETEAQLKEYSKLAAKESHTKGEESHLQRLGKELNVRVPAHHEREEARLAYQAIESGVQANLRKLEGTAREEVLREVKLQLQESITGSRRPE